MGDLINNIKADRKGEVYVEYLDDLVELKGERSVIGRMVVIHADRDDLAKGTHDDSPTTGHAGPRIACAVIGLAAPQPTCPAPPPKTKLSSSSHIII